MYKQYNDSNGQLNEHAIIRTTDNVCIPFDPANTDFLAYQKWLAEGNQPLPPDEPTLPETV